MEQTRTKHPRTRSPIQQNRHLQGMLLSLLLIGTVVIFLMLGLVIRDREFSQQENRNLTQAPELTWTGLADGSFFSQLDSYTADQFPGRDGWISIDLWMKRTLGQKESGGVYLCDDDYLMQIPGEPNEEQLSRNLAALDAFASAHPGLKTYMTVVPQRSYGTGGQSPGERSGAGSGC